MITCWRSTTPPARPKEIIARLSDLSRKNTSLTFQYVSPDELVRKVLAVASPARPPHVEVRTDLACRHLWLRGNEIQLSQMLLNLILNAYHAMEPGGGTLTVATPAGGGVSLLPGLRHRLRHFAGGAPPTSLSPSLPPRSVARAPAWDWPSSGR